MHVGDLLVKKEFFEISLVNARANILCLIAELLKIECMGFDELKHISPPGVKNCWCFPTVKDGETESNNK